MATMEQVHGVDVSWMTQSSPTDKVLKPSPPPARKLAPAEPRQTPDTSFSTPTSSPIDIKTNGHMNGHTNGRTNGNANGVSPSPPANGMPIPRRLSRSGSIDRQGHNGTPPQRRNSWFSNISAKLSGSAGSPPPGGTIQPHNGQGPTSSPTPKQPPAQSPDDQSDPLPPKMTAPKNAVLQPAVKAAGDAPYTPAPPKSTQAGFLGVFRRLSSSNGSAMGPGGRLGHGLVERRVLNVDKYRQKCPIVELNDAKLRRVAFSVDVEIAPMPKYADGEVQPKAVDKDQRKMMTEKGEGEALKNPKAVEAEKEEEESTEKRAGSPPVISTDGVETKETEAKQTTAKDASAKDGQDASKDAAEDEAAAEADKDTKKRDKKKKSEEERKARKEKKRKLAEVNGSVPMEIHYDSGSDTPSPVGEGYPKTTSMPTTNPVRIYRRCCQLRESPILKKITEQLMDETNFTATTGVVHRLDLSNYWLQLGDLVTLGDYLAVVPVREVNLDGSDLTDEGLRVILAGLLAAKRPDAKRRKPKHELEDYSGVLEQLVLKNNKLGPDGWKYLSLFVYRCNSLKYLDISNIPFPRQAASCVHNGELANGVHIPRGIADIFATALARRRGGSTLELINLCETEPSMEQLGIIIDGVIECGVRRLGLAKNHLDEQGVEHVARYLAAGKCEGIDLSGNDLNTHLEKIVSSVKEEDNFWALGVSNCNLQLSPISKALPKLAKLKDLRFIDISHNQDLFQSTPNIVGSLRRYLPKMVALKRIHLQDVNMSAEQAIALIEVLPEIRSLAHINLLGNAELVALADAKTEEAQEEACALYASLMASARLSTSLICVDIEVPSAQAGEVVKAMAKQVVAYCLRNMGGITNTGITAGLASAVADTGSDVQNIKPPGYSDVLVHLVGEDIMNGDDADDDDDDGGAPDEDYVIGGTGVVKALTCCLENRGDESPRESGEFARDSEGGEPLSQRTLATGGKAKDMSKHLLAGARKIRHRLQPALRKAQTTAGDEQNLRKLMFLDHTLQGIIKRFEDEFPDTREDHDNGNSGAAQDQTAELSPSTSVAEDPTVAVSDGEEESEIHPAKPLSRSNSVMSKALAEEEARIHRAGHRFRSGFFRPEHFDLLSSIDDIANNPQHMTLLTEMAEELGPAVMDKVREKGVVRAFKEDKELVYEAMKEANPEFWESYVESQQKARANLNISVPPTSGGKIGGLQTVADESAIVD